MVSKGQTGTKHKDKVAPHKQETECQIGSGVLGKALGYKDFPNIMQEKKEKLQPKEVELELHDGTVRARP